MAKATAKKKATAAAKATSTGTQAVAKKKTTASKATAKKAASAAASSKAKSSAKKTAAKPAKPAKKSTSATSTSSNSSKKTTSKKVTSKKATAKKTTTKKVAAKSAAKKATSKSSAAPKNSEIKTKATTKAADNKAKANAAAKPKTTKASAAKKASTSSAGSDKKMAKNAALSPDSAIDLQNDDQLANAELEDNSVVGGARPIVPYERKKDSDYMNEEQLKYFRELLAERKQQLMEEVDRTVGHMKDDATNFPDPNDRATQEEEFSLELRTRDRERKLLKKISEAQKRIDDDEFGYCETCGIEIGVERLRARPTAELCIDCKTLEEIRERQIA